MNGVNGVNGVNGDASGSAMNGPPQPAVPPRMNDLPDRIQHVTNNYIPLALLLQRLAQKTHNNLQDVIRDLARKTVAGMPGSGGGGGGNNNNSNNNINNNTPGDGSIDNIEKKKALLHFARSEHASWVKALVITEWSKKADQISKLIDLENHMYEEELIKYEQAVYTMLNLKRNLGGARLPSPDLKTALHVLARGTAPWMPDLGFVAAPPLSATDQAKRLDDISTLLALRLNLDDYDTIPYHFRDSYTIASGRVTFRVRDEFEVDLTLASDDFSQQLWFLDLRFLFAPAPEEDMTPVMRGVLEQQMNLVLEHEGLPGCYRLLHEFTLTHKISELRRQLHELARGRWIETVRVENLQRAVSVQYWTAQGLNNSRHWFIVGVHSGHDAASTELLPDEQITSRLHLRWFRDGKEVKEEEEEGTEQGLAEIVAANTAGTVSAERILQAVAARHVEHVLAGIHAKLAAKPLFAQRRAAMQLRICRADASRSCLDVQLSGPGDRVRVRIDPVTGHVSLSPQYTRAALSAETRLNAAANSTVFSSVSSVSVAADGKDPVDEGVALLEGARCAAAHEDLGRRAKSYGWTVVRHGGQQQQPVARLDDVRQVISSRDHHQVLWLKRLDWAPQWHVLASLSLGGDRWWLVKLSEQQQPAAAQETQAQRNEFTLRSDGARILMHMLLPMGTRVADFNKAFFADLTVYATGIMTQYTDTQALARRSTTSAEAWFARAENPYLPRRAKLPALRIRLSELLSSEAASSNNVPLAAAANATTPAVRRWWASDHVQLLFRGIDGSQQEQEQEQTSPLPHRRLAVLAEARLAVQDRLKFRLLATARRTADDDVAYVARTGEFRLYLRAAVGHTVVDTLVERLRAIERLVGFLDAIRRQGRAVFAQSVSLHRLVFSYTVGPGARPADVTTEAAVAAARAVTSCGRWRVSVDLSRSGEDVRLQLEDKCPHLRVADYLGRLANHAATLATLPFFLTATLSLYRALDRMEDAWEPIVVRNIGMLTILPRALDWVVVRIMLLTPGGAGAGAGAGGGAASPARSVRQLALDIRLRTRRNEPVWQIRRVEEPSGAGHAASAAAADDDLSKAMRRIFEGSGPGWQGLATAAVASPYPGQTVDESEVVAGGGTGTGTGTGASASSAPPTPRGATGIEDCLLQIDEAIRGLQVTAMAPGLHTAQMLQMQQRRAQATAQAQAQAQAQQGYQAQTARMG